MDEGVNERRYKETPGLSEAAPDVFLEEPAPDDFLPGADEEAEQEGDARDPGSRSERVDRGDP